MKKLKKILFLVILILLILFGTWKIMNTSNKNMDNPKSETATTKNVELYKMMLEYIMEVDTDLQHDMEYISLDIKTFPNLTNKEQKELLTFMEKYHSTVKPNSFKELDEQGLFHKDGFYLDGILISNEKVEFFSENEVEVTMMKYRGGDGAIFLVYKMKYDNGTWNMNAYLRGIS